MKVWGRRLLQRLWEWAGSVSIRTKIFGIVLGTSLLLSAAFIFQVRLALYHFLATEAQQQGISIARDLAARSTDLILINDLYSLYQLLKDTQANFRDVRYVFVVSPEGEVLAHTFEGGFPSGLLGVNRVEQGMFEHTVVLQTDEGLVWDVAVPIFEGRAGTVRVGVSDQSVRTTLLTLLSQMAFTLVVVLAASLLAATFLTWVLTRPILDLVEAAQAVGRGDFSVRIRRWANDELGDLADAFNQMASDLGRMEDLRREREALRRQLLERVIRAQEEERRAIARELHDSTSQYLSSLMMGLRALANTTDSPLVRQQAEELRQIAAQTLEDVHRLAVQLRPAILDDLGLKAALEHLCHEWQHRVGVAVDLLVHLPRERLPEAVETALFRIVQEAMTNVARHAQASQVSLLIECRDGAVIAIIEDDGRGFDPNTVDRRQHLGLLGMRERAALLGGQMEIESREGQGTSIFVRIPIDGGQD